MFNVAINTKHDEYEKGLKSLAGNSTGRDKYLFQA